MRISYSSDYLSITNFNPIEIPRFTILTGLNGAGKSHFLQAIESGHIEVSGLKSSKIILFGYEDFRLETEGNSTAHQLEVERNNAWNLFEKQLLNPVRSWKQSLGDTYSVAQAKAVNARKSLWDLEEGDFQDPLDYENLGRFRDQVEAHFQNNRDLKNNQEAKGILALLREIPFSIDTINREQFDELYKPYVFKNDFLPNSLGKVLWDYYVRLSRNNINAYNNEKNGTDFSVLSEREFEQKYGRKPWNIVNNILGEFDTLDYHINSPEGLDPFGSYQLKLVHSHKSNLEIDFSALSSGERVLMALVASIYKTSSDKHFPGLLLLDEIDTSLHPSMVQNMLNVINNVFLAQGVNVILVSHSPTTVAIADENSLYVMNRSGIDRIQKADKNKALNILTEGFATLDEGIRLFDQISKKEISVVTEGNNVAYLERALSLIDGELGKRVEIVTGVEGKSGKNQLKTLFDFFQKVPHKNKVVFVWDPDVDWELEARGETYPFILSRNNENTKVQNGIENLFDTRLFSDHFYDGKDKSDGGFVSNLSKSRFKDYMMDQGTKEDFRRFEPFVELLRSLVGSEN